MVGATWRSREGKWSGPGLGFTFDEVRANHQPNHDKWLRTAGLPTFAPVWYTEEHHNRAVTALRIFDEFRQRAKSEAARSQKAG